MTEFETFWQKTVCPLQGEIIRTLDKGIENKILSVTSDYLERKSTRSSNSKKQKVPKASFQEIFEWLKKEKVLKRSEINERYKGGRSSIIAAILSRHDAIERRINPVRLIWKQ